MILGRLPRRRRLIVICIILIVLIIIADVFAARFTDSGSVVASRLKNHLNSAKDGHRGELSQGSPAAATSSTAPSSSEDTQKTEDNQEAEDVQEEEPKDEATQEAEDRLKAEEYRAETEPFPEESESSEDSHAGNAPEDSSSAHNSEHTNTNSKSLDNDPFYEDQCQNYFQKMYDADSNWGIEPYKYGDDARASHATRDSLKHLRMYLNCFLRNNVARGPLKLPDLERKLFPSFLHAFPDFTRYDGYQVQGRFPNKDDYEHSIQKRNEHSDHVPSSLMGDDYSFYNDLKDQSYGRGIVVSISDGEDVNELMRLIHVLRMQGNKLPIQLVHKGDLGHESQRILTKAAREPFAVPKDEFMPYKVNNRDRNGDIYTKRSIKYEQYDELIENPQDLWYVNVNNLIHPDSQNLFTTYYNKWLAVLFNSFDDMALFDTDAVPFLNANDFFEMEEYRKHRAFLFQDRAISNWRTINQDIIYKESLLPFNDEIEMFKMDPITDFTRNNRYFGDRHAFFVESGLVLISKQQHLAELLMGVSLNFFTTAGFNFYGDKEFFWFGFAISGSEQYVINDLPAGSLGVKEHHSMTKPDGSSFNYDVVASTQPTHMNKRNQLLWLNGGMQTCKFPGGAKQDYESFDYVRNRFKSEDDFRYFLESPAEAEGVMVLEVMEPAKIDHAGIEEVGIKQCAVRGCLGRMWCAYDSEEYPALWLPFDTKTKEIFNKVSRYWMADPVYFPDANGLNKAKEHLGH